MIKEYNINDYLKEDKELQKAVIQELINENEKLKEEVADLEDLAEFKEKYIRELSSNINVKIGQITAMEMFNKQANEYNLKYKQALEQVGKYCSECNLKADYTACEVLKIINEVLDE